MTPDTLNGIRSTILEGYALSTKQAVDLLGAYEEALAALEPFSDVPTETDELPDDTVTQLHFLWTVYYSLTLGHFRRARDVCFKAGGPHD